MTENSNSNDDNGADQIAMTDDLFGLPGDGLHWTWQRCGRYEYRKVLMHSTNPDHLVPSVALGSGGFLRVAARYAAGRKRCSTTSWGFSARCGTRSRRTARALPVTSLWTGLARG